MNVPPLIFAPVECGKKDIEGVEKMVGGDNDSDLMEGAKQAASRTGKVIICITLTGPISMSFGTVPTSAFSPILLSSLPLLLCR